VTASPAQRRDARAADVAVVLVWLVLAILPVGRLAELPLLACALLGVPTLWRARARLTGDPGLRMLLVAFACYWLPMLVSAFDAVAPAKAWTEVAADLRLLPFGALVVVLLGGHPDRLRRLYWLAAVVVTLWAADALAQAVTGYSLGGRLGGDRVSGVFGDGNQKLGPVLAVLSPFVLYEALDRYGRRGLAIAWTVLCAAILLAGARAGWIAFAVVTVVVAARLAHGARQFFAWGAAFLGIALALVALGYVGSARFAARVDRTLALDVADSASLDVVLAGRVPIYRTSAAMVAAHPINGVGVRGFRYAYPEYAAPDDPWVDARTRTGALHAHHVVLELLTETGVVGLLAWLVAVVALWRAHAKLTRHERHLAHPPALALVAMLFPLNTHYAFYSSFWAIVLWWLVALACAALDPRVDGHR
jgi:O-antigen ligase